MRSIKLLYSLYLLTYLLGGLGLGLENAGLELIPTTSVRTSRRVRDAVQAAVRALDVDARSPVGSSEKLTAAPR